MNFLKMINENAAYLLLGMTAVILLLLILVIVNMVQNSKMKQKYKKFMMGKDCKSMEDNLIQRVSEIEELITANKENKRKIDNINRNLNDTFQKVGMVKYDAFHEMGGKLSFSLAMLDKENDGFIINAVHSREGCYTYIKEIIKGNSVILLSDEEKEALEMAMEIKNKDKIS